MQIDTICTIFKKPEKPMGFFTFYKFFNWFQIAQRITYCYETFFNLGKEDLC